MNPDEKQRPSCEELAAWAGRICRERRVTELLRAAARAFREADEL